MNKNKIVLFFLLFLPGLFLYSEDFDVEYEGELRTRAAYENNFDLDYDTVEGSLVADAMAKIEFKVTTPIPLYMYYKLQLGNIATDGNWFDTGNLLENIRLETRELYFGWEASNYEIKLGLVSTGSPSDVVVDEENAGIKFNYDFDICELKSFYSMTNLIDGYFNFIESGEGLNHLFFFGAESGNYLNSDLNLWSMFLDGNDQDSLSYNPLWLGIELENNNDFFDIETSFIYNGGSVYLDAGYEVPISAFYTNMKISTEPVVDTVVFSRFNLTSSLESDTATINQFQVIDGEGSLDTGLGLLFGGSSYGSESYFGNNSVSLIEDNLSSGDIVVDDPGLFIYEFGISQKFDFLPLTSDLIIGGANTGSMFSGDGYFSSLIGLEMDLHNKMKLSEQLSFYLSLCLLFPGNAFEEVFVLNNSSINIGSDPSFKTDLKFVYSY